MGDSPPPQKKIITNEWPKNPQIINGRPKIPQILPLKPHSCSPTFVATLRPLPAVQQLRAGGEDAGGVEHDALLALGVKNLQKEQNRLI